MKSLMLILTTLLTANGIPLVDAAEHLKSGVYYITQSWSQETAFKRPYYVSVPESADQQKFPVFIFLHGHGGNAKDARTRRIAGNRRGNSDRILERRR